MVAEADRKVSAQRDADVGRVGDESSNVTSLDDRRAERNRSKPHDARHGRAMLDEADTESPTDSRADQELDESGRRESNSRSQLGKLMFCL